MVKPSIDLFPFQGEGIRFALEREGALIADEMGLGKTVQAIGLINRDPTLRKILIVCPASMRIPWRRELERWLNRPFSIAVVGVDVGFVQTLFSKDILVINYDKLSRFTAELSARTYDLCVLDECHYVKSLEAKRTGAALGIKARRRLALSGTPIPNRPIEIYPVLSWLRPQDWPREGYFDFAQRYCNPPDAPIWMGDFSFKPLGEVRVGDKIIGWVRDNERPWRKKHGRREHKNPDWNKRRLVKTTVLAVQHRYASLVKITMASGRTIRCTPDHRWLSGRSHGSDDCFVPARFPDGVLCHVIDPTPNLSPTLLQNAGWLGGMFDGEGTWPTIAQCPTANGDVYDRIPQTLTSLGFEYSEVRSRPGFSILGGRTAAVCFLNWCRPSKRTRIENGVLTTKFITPDPVVAIAADGEGEVISLTTETGNYIAWGYCSKNCGAYHNGFGWDFSGASNLTELSSRLHSSVMIRRTKAQVLPQLPEKIRTVVELYPASAEINRMIKQELDAYEARFLKVNHDSINWHDLARVRHQTALVKVPLIVQFLTEVLEGGVPKVVVFAHHRDVIAQLVDRLSEYRPVMLIGGMGPQERQDSIDAFQSYPSVRVFIGNIQAAGNGITLAPASSRCIFAELSWTPAEMTQCEDRLHRIGTKDSVHVQHLVLEESLDAMMVRVLIRKQRILDAVLQDHACAV